MNEREIEIRAERMMDRLDARYMSEKIGPAEYDAGVESIRQWVREQYAARTH